MDYINYINAYENQQAIEAALLAGTLQKPYVALDLSAGTVDFDSIIPAPQAETRLKCTYHTDQPGEFVLIGEPYDSTLVSVEINGVVIPLGDNYDNETYGDVPTYTAASSGDYVAYFTFSGDTIGANDEYSHELFYNWASGEDPIPVVAIEIPANLPHIGHNSFAYVGNNGDTLSALTLPDVPMTFEKEAFRGNTRLQVVKTASMSGTGYVYIPSGSTLDRYAFGDCGSYWDEQTFEHHKLLTAATFGAGVNFVDSYWEDEGDEYPKGYQFEETPIRVITFLGTVPPTIQMNTFYWEDEWQDEEFHTYRSNAQVPTGYESDYVSSFNSQLWDNSEGLGWYFVEGLYTDDHYDCEAGPTPGHIFAVLEPDAAYRCELGWGTWDEEGEVCHECGWEPDPCDDWAGAGYSSYEECNCAEHGEDCPEGE